MPRDRWLDAAEDASVSLILGRQEGGSNNSRRGDYIALDDLDENGQRPKKRHVPFSERGRKGPYLFFIGILLIIIIVGAGASRFERNKDNEDNKNDDTEDDDVEAPPQARLYNNGTYDFNPTTLVISLDGFHPHYIHRDRTPNLMALFDSGLSAPYMTPSFPSQTFPNHWTLATGLYPANHGIVGNTFYDPKLKRQFFYKDPEQSLDPVFWGGEPIWAAMRRSNKIAAVHMWPGSEVDWGKRAPQYVDAFNATEELSIKKDRIFEWLDLPIPERPELLMAYVPTVDTVGHQVAIFGPELEQSLTDVDDLVGSIVSGLEDRNLTDIVNVVIVSDHGMAPTSDDRLLFLDDEVDMSNVDIRQGWPLAGLRFNADAPADLAKTIAAKQYKGAKAYLSDELPAQYHFSSKMRYGRRMAPVYLVPELGWSILTHKEYADLDFKYTPHGVHGYNNTDVLMRAMFVAKGPSFQPGQVQPFPNVNVYSLIARSLDLSIGGTDGSALLKPFVGAFEEGYPGTTFETPHFNESYFDEWPLK